LLDRLFGAGARVVMFDMIFSPPNDGDPAFHAALDRYHDKVVVGANFDMRTQPIAVTPNNTLIPPPQLQDDRVGFVNFWADPIDGKIRAVTYRVTDRQLARFTIGPKRRSLSISFGRALAKIGHANDVPQDFRGHLIRFTSRTRLRPDRSTKFSIQSFGMPITPTARFLRTKS
jgi:CHASE2 domain-containing sensor protein